MPSPQPSGPNCTREEAYRLLGITISRPIARGGELAPPSTPLLTSKKKKRRTAPAIRTTASGESGKLLLGWQQHIEPKQMGFRCTNPPTVQAPNTPLYSDDGEAHVVAIGPTGSGKGVSSLMPILLTSRSSVVVVDVKGECVAVAAMRRKKMGQTVVVIDPFEITAWKERGSLNPLDIQKLTDEPIENLAMELPQLLRGENRNGPKNASDGDFWDVKADGLVGGVLAHLLSAPSEGTDRTLIMLRDILMADDPIYLLATLLDKAGKTMPALATKQLASFLATTDVTRSGILATATDRVSALFHPGIERALGSTSFDLAGLRDGKPISIFLVIPPGKLKSHGRVLKIWISVLMSLMQTRKRLPALPSLFLVDEAAQLGAMDQLRTAMTLLRGFGVRSVLYFQDISQIKRLYEDWETLVNNATIQILGTNTQPAAKAAAEITGSVFTTDMILQLPKNEGILIQKGNAIRFRKLNYLTDEMFRGIAARNPMFAGLPEHQVAEKEVKSGRQGPVKTQGPGPSLACS